MATPRPRTTKARPVHYSDKTADLSADETYRYALSRTWDARLDRVLFVMLNPSTADAFEDDPTIRRCVGYARAWGYGTLHVVNLFALRATDPKALYGHPDPVGGENDRFILDRAARCAVRVAAWGAHGGHIDRGKTVCRLLFGAGLPLHCLARTKDGHPGHPLYLGGSLTPVPYTAQRGEGDDL